MQFETLKEKCEFYRTLGEHRLMPNGHIIMMLDGRSFSKMIKNKFKKPFDHMFIGSKMFRSYGYDCRVSL